MRPLLNTVTLKHNGATVGLTRPKEPLVVRLARSSGESSWVVVRTPTKEGVEYVEQEKTEGSFLETLTQHFDIRRITHALPRYLKRGGSGDSTFQVRPREELVRGELYTLSFVECTETTKGLQCSSGQPTFSINVVVP